MVLHNISEQNSVAQGSIPRGAVLKFVILIATLVFVLGMACAGDSEEAPQLVERPSAIATAAPPSTSGPATVTAVRPPPTSQSSPTASAPTSTPSCPLSSPVACQTLFRVDEALDKGDTDAVAGMFRYEDAGCAAYTDPLMIISPVIARYAGCLAANPDLETRCLWVLNERTPAPDCRATLAAIHTCSCGQTNANFRYLTREQLRDLILPQAHVIGVIESVGFNGPEPTGPFIVIDAASLPIPDPYGSPLPSRWALKIDEQTGDIEIAFPHNAGPGYYFANADFIPWD